MLEERCIVGPGAERADAKIPSFFYLAPVRHSRPDKLPGAPSFGDRSFGFRILHLTCNLIYKTFEGMRALGAEEAAIVTVAVDVYCGVLAQFLGMRFGPLC